MAIGPVQLMVLGFDHPEFHGEIVEELEKLRESDTVRVIDALAVHKDAAGEIEVMHLSNLTKDEAIELGSKVGALIGLGIEGEEGFGSRRGDRCRSGGRGDRGLLGRGRLGRPRGDPERLRRRAAPDRAPLGGAAPRRDRPGGRLPPRRRVHQPARPDRDRPRLGRGGSAAARHGEELVGRIHHEPFAGNRHRPRGGVRCSEGAGESRGARLGV